MGARLAQAGRYLRVRRETTVSVGIFRFTLGPNKHGKVQWLCLVSLSNPHALCMYEYVMMPDEFADRMMVSGCRRLDNG